MPPKPAPRRPSAAAPAAAGARPAGPGAPPARGRNTNAGILLPIIGGIALLGILMLLIKIALREDHNCPKIDPCMRRFGDFEFK